MNILLIIVAVIASIIALFLIIALFVKKEYTIEREVTINRPGQEIFDYVKYLKNQDNYSKWVMADPGMKKTFKGTDGAVGFVYAWESDNKNVGKGEQEIRDIVEGESIDIEIRFIKPFEGTGITRMIIEPISENQTRVKWGMKGKSSYPMNFMNLFMGAMLGKDLETSLSNLKGVLEAKQEEGVVSR